MNDVGAFDHSVSGIRADGAFEAQVGAAHEANLQILRQDL